MLTIDDIRAAQINVYKHLKPPPHNQGDMEILEKMYLINDHEHWLLGDPEIYVVIAGEITGNSRPPLYQNDFNNVNDTYWRYGLYANLFAWNTNQVGNYFMIAVIESDLWGNYIISGADPGYSYETWIQAVNGDDMVGLTKVQFTDFPASYNLMEDTVIGAKIWMDYSYQ